MIIKEVEVGVEEERKKVRVGAVHKTKTKQKLLTCTFLAQARFVSSPCVLSSANCAASLASAMHPGRRPSPIEREMSYSALFFFFFFFFFIFFGVFFFVPGEFFPFFLFLSSFSLSLLSLSLPQSLILTRCPGSPPSACTQSSRCGRAGTAWRGSSRRAKRCRSRGRQSAARASAGLPRGS